MYIEGFDKAVQDELQRVLEDATKWNSGIFELTLAKKEDTCSLSNYRQGNHGDIIKYIDEEVKTLEDMKAVFKAFIQGLNKECNR